MEHETRFLMDIGQLMESYEPSEHHLDVVRVEQQLAVGLVDLRIAATQSLDHSLGAQGSQVRAAVAGRPLRQLCQYYRRWRVFPLIHMDT